MYYRDLYRTLKDITSFNNFIEIVKKDNVLPQSLSELEEDKIIVQFPFKSPEQGILIRQLAMAIKPEGDFSEDRKEKYQRYWLGCCYKQECDYYFALYRELGIDREDDIVTLAHSSVLFQNLPYEGEKFYRDVCVKFLLKRYALINAWKVWNCQGFFGFNLLLPRLLGAIIIGFIPLVMADEVWQFPSKLYATCACKFWIFISLLLVISLLYLIIECRNTIGKFDFRDFIFRVCPVFFIGAFYSFMFAFLIAGQFLRDIPTNEITNFWATIGSFAASALLIGIFLQVFWEEKTITEPL